MIEVEHAAQPLTSLDPIIRVRGTRRALDQVVREALMVPLEPVVLHELRD
jgi:hypothetical protein